MRAMVIVAGISPELRELTPRLPAALVPCVDRPILQHMVEVLVDHGFAEIDFVLHESANEIESFLGEGSRWGCKFTFHLVIDPARPYGPLKLLPAEHNSVLLVHADRIPLLPEPTVLSEHATHDAFVYLSKEENESVPGRWTGCAFIRPSNFRDISEHISKAELEQKLRESAGAGEYTSLRVLDFHDFGALLNSQEKILEGVASISHLAARQVEPGIWIARNVVIHPTAQLTAPVFIGENSRIGSGVVLGPNAVIGHDTIVDQYTQVIEAAILPGSYCGEHLELDHVIVDRNRLVSCKFGTAVNISDSFILSGLKANGSRKQRSLLSCVLGGILFVLTLPVTFLTAIVLLAVRGATPLHRKPVAQLPATENEPLETFNLYSFRDPVRQTGSFTRIGWLLLDFLPALGQVAAGNLHLVGVPPRTPQEISQLPADWRSLYLNGQAGLLTEAFVIHGPSVEADDLYSCEAYYTAVHGVSHDISLMFRFMTGKA